MPPEPDTDANSYVDMAKNGVLGNPNLLAPFAYRPGMPLIVHLVMKTTGYTVEEGFQFVGTLMGIGFLLSIFALAQSCQASFKQAVVIMIIMGLSFQHIKFPLFFYSLVDIAAYPFIVLAFLFLISRQYVFSALFSLIGLLFKEFLAIPWILLIYALFVEYKSDRSKKSLLLVGLVTLLGICIILIPRMFLPVVGTTQYIDPINNIGSLQRLVLPLSGDPWSGDGKSGDGRVVNMVFAVLSYWIPSLILLNPSRLKSLVIGLKKDDIFALCLIFVAINMLLVLYGGSNIIIFVSYMAPVQAVVLVYLFKFGVKTWELLYMLFVLVAFNKISLEIPLYRENVDAYLDFYGGYASRVNGETIMRLLVCVIYILIPVIVRYLGSVSKDSQKLV